ncbi:unnamed protein product [Sympodiomycopsis kandeliae]
MQKNRSHRIDAVFHHRLYPGCMLARSLVQGLGIRSLNTQSRRHSVLARVVKTITYTFAKMAPTPPPSPPAKKAKIEVQADDSITNSTTSNTINGSSDTTSQASAGMSKDAIQETSLDAILRQYPIPKRDANFTKRTKNRKKAHQATLAKTGQEPIWFDIVELLGKAKVEQVINADGGDGQWIDRFPRDTILTGKVERLSAHGVGLIIAPTQDWILAVPTVLAGEVVKVRVDHSEMLYSKCDLVEILEKSPERRDDLIGCKYFGDCGGCQYQMLPYETQLKIKQDVVTRAFSHFSNLDPSLIPATLPTLPSPEQYEYRTKLTPHFNLPRSLLDHRGGGSGNNFRGKRRNRNGAAKDKINVIEDQDELEALHQKWSDETQIGFDGLKKGGKTVMDIEECPIATKVINKALPIEKAKVRKNIASYQAGASLLLRDSMTSEAFGPTPEGSQAPHAGNPATRDGGPISATEGTSEVVTSYRATVREKVESVRFETPSGSFFQNNRSILPSLIEYVRQAILEARSGASQESQDHYLVDTYCGSGLFALLLAPLFTQVAGVEISTESIAYAKRNAVINSLDNVEFLAGNAEEIFGKIEYESDKTTVVIDPPRRGCDEPFLKQLLQLSPSLIVYVSCNVHTQARDVGYFLQHSRRQSQEGSTVGDDYLYEIVSIRGADLFPQTHHVEGVCVLRKKKSAN